MNLRSSGLFTLLVVICGIFTTGCKKNPVNTSSRSDLTKDSIYLYAQQTYYWNSSLPAFNVFSPRQFSTNDDEIFALTKYSLNPATGKYYEYSAAHPSYPKYSFMDDGSEAAILGGTGGDYGFSVFFASETDLRVKYVYGTSPADVKGLKRGFQITKLNGRTDLSSAISSDVNFVTGAIFGTNASVTMTVKKPDGSSADITVVRGTYTINPILYSTVFTAGAKKVGYIVFNSFTTNAEAQLKATFAGFATQGITELIVDLRYNGGGSISTAEIMSNLIVPTSASGTTMYDSYFNTTMQNGDARILENQKFNDNGQIHSYYEFDYSVAGNRVKFDKTGALNVNRVYFLVTGSTGSASELLINNLRPVMDVKLIGKKTYGKPVAFFALRINKSDLYIPQWETKNQAGVGGYYDGMAVDKEDTDDLTRDFGDPAEKLVADALTYAVRGAFGATNPKEVTIKSTANNTLSAEEIDALTQKFDAGLFKGMVGSKFKFKKNK